MKNKLTFLLLFFVFFSNAQSPWRAKLIIYSLDNNNQLSPDTVWFGCDSLGDVGFQLGLDEKTTGLKDHAVSIDQSTLDTLKTNIQSFNKNKVTSFNFQCLRKVQYIVWDTLEIYYPPTDSLFMIEMYLTAPENVSLGDIWHKSQIQIYEAKPSINAPRNFYYRDSILVTEGGSLMPFSITVVFGDSIFFKHIYVSSVTGRLNEGYEITQSESSVKVISKKEGAKPFSVSVYSTNGGLMLEEQNCVSSHYEFDWSYFNNGIYIVEIWDDEVKVLKKIFKY